MGHPSGAIAGVPVVGRLHRLETHLERHAELSVRSSMAKDSETERFPVFFWEKPGIYHSPELTNSKFAPENRPKLPQKDMNHLYNHQFSGAFACCSFQREGI